MRAAESARRYAALARAVVRARRQAFDPFKLTWIVTEACSLRCRTCHLWASAPHPGPDLPTVRRVMAANRHLTWINLSGGDMVERPDAPELVRIVVEEARDLALLDFPTAGQDARATLAALQPALDSEVPRIYVTVSLDGDDATHDRLRGSRGSAARARRTYERLAAIRRPGFRVVVGTTLSRHNLSGAPGGHDPLPPGIPARDLHLNLAHHSPHYYRNATDVAPPAAAAVRVIDGLMRRRRWPLGPLDLLERRYWAVARRFLREGDSGRACGALRGVVFLAADLTVHACSIDASPLGSLADVGFSLRRIGELPRASAALRRVDERACPRCWSPCEAFPTLLLGLGKGR